MRRNAPADYCRHCNKICAIGDRDETILSTRSTLGISVIRRHWGYLRILATRSGTKSGEDATTKKRDHTREAKTKSRARGH